MLFILYSVLLIAILIPLIYLLGSFFQKCISESDVVLRGVIISALGLGMLVYFMMLLGSLGYLQLWPLIVFAVLVFICRLAELNHCREWLVALKDFFWCGNGFLLKITQFVLIGTSLLTLSLCFLPELANDSLSHQLNLPKVFIRNSSTLPDFFDLNTYIPMFMQYLYVVGLLLQSIAAAKFFHWWTGILLTIALCVVIERKTGNKLISYGLAALFWLTPTVANQITTTYVDVAVTFFMFLSFIIFVSAFKTERIKDFFLAGLLLGFAISSKLLVLVGGVAMAVVYLIRWLELPRKAHLLKAGFVFAFAVLLGVGYWFVRNALITGNPVFPYLGDLFGTQVFPFYGSYSSMGQPKTILSFFLIPWSITMQPQFYDMGHWVGPLYLLVLPAAIIAIFYAKESRPYLIFTFVFTTFWFFMAQNVRYLLPCLPVYLVAAAYGLKYLGEKFTQRAGQILVQFTFIGVLFGLLALTAYHYRYQYFPIIGKWNVETYLEKMERSYPIAEWINENLPEDAKIFNAEEIRQLYMNRDLVREGWIRLRSEYLQIEDHAKMFAFWKKHGFTHILRAYQLNSRGEPIQQERHVFLDQVLKSSEQVKPRVTMKSKNIREHRYLYTVYELM